MNVVLALMAAVVLALGAAVYLLWSSRRGLAKQTVGSQRVMELANDPVLIADIVDGSILKANQAACSLFGCDGTQLPTKRLPDLHPRDLRGRSAEIIADVWEKKGLVYSDLPFVRLDGSSVDVEVSANIIEYEGKPAILLFARDITERLEAERKIRSYADELEKANKDLRDMQAQLVQSGKMASLGNLAAGLAHEINNPIGALKANMDLSSRAVSILRESIDTAESKPAPRVQKAVDALEKVYGSSLEASDRIANLVKSLRNFARLDEAEFKRVDIHEGIDSALVLMGHEIGDDVTIERRFGEVPEVECYPTQLNQAFMAVLKNAIQAIDGAGKVVVATGVEDGMAFITLEDTGKGIAPEHQESIFDPGYTTLGSGVGAGLGLPTAFRIMQNHQGSIDITSEVGRGTTVTLRFPMSR